MNGQTVSSDTHKPEHWQTQYSDIKYTDFLEKGYTFNTPTWINGIQLNRLVYGEKNVFTENMFDKLNVEYHAEGKWHPVPAREMKIASNPMYNEILFTQPVKTEALRFINKRPDDLNRYIYKIRVKEAFKQSYNIRCVKLDNSLLLFIDGKQIAEIDADKTPAQVGLYSEKAVSGFNGILRYHTP